MSESSLSTCEECGGKIERVITGGTGLIFKGSGFYLTDYKDREKTDKNSVKKDEGETEKSKANKKETKESNSDKKSTCFVESSISSTVLLLTTLLSILSLSLYCL